jgi:hypothetical protein
MFRPARSFAGGAAYRQSERKVADPAVCDSLDEPPGTFHLMGSPRMLETDMEDFMQPESPMELVIATALGAILLRVDLRGRQKLTLGRSRKCDVRLTGPGISRHHAVLFEEAGRWMLLATSPRHGVWLGEERITTAAISEEKSLRIGELYLWFYGRNVQPLLPPRISPYPAPTIALRAEYIESLWRLRALMPADGAQAPSRAA